MYEHGGHRHSPDFYTLQNVSWQNDPITLSRPDGCITLAVDFEFYEREAELGRKINLFQDSVTNKVYDCAVSNFNSKLIEVAKKCDGRWF